jgi:hypothetical protein
LRRSSFRTPRDPSSRCMQLRTNQNSI